MSCLLDNESRRALRVQIATDFIENIKSDEPFEILPYVKSIYEFFKAATEDEALALDAARLVPTLALQIINNDADIKSGLRKKDRTIGSKLDDLELSYEENIEQLREDVGAADVAAETIVEVQKDVDTAVAEREAQKEQEEKLNEQFITPYGAFRSFGLEVKNFENPNAPGYMEVDPKMAHLFNVMRAINDKMQEQIRTNGINDSSEMTYPGVDGGVFLQIVAAPYGELKMTLVDKNGSPIKFADGTTDVSPDGKEITYNVASDPLRNASGDIITDEKEFKKALDEALKKDPKAKGRLLGAFNNVQQAIKAQTEWTKSEVTATQIVKDQFKLQKQMRDYLQGGEGRYVTATINGASKGVVNQNIWKYTDLNDVDFKTSPFRPIVVTTEQTASSLYSQGNLLFKYDGIEKPITAIAKSFVEREGLLNTVVQLFTSDLFKELAGKRERLEVQERNELIEQYMFTSDVKFISNAVGGNARNYIDSKRRMKLKIGEKEYLIRFESNNETEAEENKKMQEEAAAALTQLLSTPYIKATEQGYGDPDLNSKEKLKDAQTQGAKLVYAAENESFEEAVKAGKITPGSIFVVMRPNKKGGTDVKDAFRVYYPKLNANNKNLNTLYQDVSFKEVDGKTVVQTKNKPYNQYILDNFSTPAATVNGKIRTVNTFLGFAATPSQVAKFTGATEKTSIPFDTKADIERRRQEELPIINVYWGSAETPNNTRVLSNLAPRKFTYNGKEYGSVEHAYQTLKSGEFDQSTYDKYVKAGGYGTKIKGKAVNKSFDNLQLMKDLVVQSFKQNPEQAKLLLKYKDFTHTTNEIIDKAFLEGLKLAKYDAELKELENNNKTLLTNETEQSVSADVEAKKADIERRKQEELEVYNKRDTDSLEAIMPNNPNHKKDKLGISVGDKFNQGQKIIVVNSKPDENYDGRENPYEVITKVIKPQLHDANGKMIQTAQVEVTLFNTKEEAEAAIQAEYKKIKSLQGKKQNKINAKYDAELAALEETSGVSGSALKDKKADIERRRQNDLEAYATGKLANSKIKLDNYNTHGKVQNVILEIGRYANFEFGGWGYFETLKGEDGRIIDSKSEYGKRIINAKYDAELAALEKAETKTEPLTSKTTSSLSKEDLMKSLLNKHKTLDKGGNVKATNARSTEEQMKAAEEWYNNSPLAKHFPFHIVYNAVNSNSNGPAAQWAIHGVTLFHYYSEDGKLDLSKSGDFTDLYHEAWHGFTQTFLTPEQREAFYNDLSKREGSFVDFKGNYVQFKIADWMQLEEFAAEEFRAYAMSGGKAKPGASATTKSTFRKILDFLKNLFKKSKTQDVIADPLTNEGVYNLYDKLYTGNLDAYNFNVTNRDQTIGSMDHALLSTDPNSKIKELGFDDANLLVSTIDSLISANINKLNLLNGDTKLTTFMMKDPETSAAAYQMAKIDLETEILPALKAKMEAEPLAGNKLLIQQDIELVEWAIANFGDTDNITSNRRSGKGLIAYHIEKSSFLSEEERDALSDKDIDEVASVIAATDLHAQAGNEKSQAELASPDVKTLLRSIHKYDKGQPVNNRLGVQELNDHHQTTSSLARILNDTTSQDAMYAKLREAAIEDKAIAEVVDKLGPPSTNSTLSKTLWINFWSTFNMASIKLVQMNIKKEGDKYDVTIGAANTYSNKIGNLWKNAFRTQPFSPFIRPNLDESTRDTYGANYLDLPALMAEFDDNNKLKKGSEFDFLRAIGIQLSDKKSIRKAVTMEGGNVGSPTHLFRKIKRLMNERNITQLYALDDIFKEYPAESKLEMIGDEKANFNDLKELETRNADYANNYMVTNAEGNTQFEQSLHNTISVMLASINEVDSYAQLMMLPHMQYLNVKNNPFAAASVWLNSIFNMDEFAVDGIGHKRKTGGISGKDVRINMSNLSGIQLIDENGDQGISSAASDEFSKLIMDFHLNTMANKPELMRHADKGTSFSVWLDRINGGSSDNKTYQDAYTFVKNDKGNIVGYDKITRIVTGYVNAELTRIKRLEDLAKETDLVYDANYLKEGQQFLIFEGILKPETKETLMKYNSVDEATDANPELQGEIEAQIIEYFENQTEDVKDLMAKAGKEFIDDTLLTTTRIKANKGISSKGVNNEQVKDGLVRAFVVNGWIHNFESMAMIYGDIAQYNLPKEDFHKRNAGAGSTGKLFAYDKGSIQYVNNKGRLYARSLGEGYPEKMMNENGEYDTAILKDNEIPSVNYDHLFDAIHKDMIRKNNNVINPDKKLSAEAVKAKATQAAKAYTENVEGDGQGWITFDFYRVLSILEGKWSPQQEQMYKDIVEGKEVENATEFFPTRKFQYCGSLKVKEGQLPLTAFHKFSLVPMIPSIVGDNNLYKDRLTNLGLLQEKMIKQDIDYATFKSGSKVSNLTPISADGKAIQDKFYSDDKEHKFKEEGTFTKNTLFLPFLKDQLEIAPYFKEKVPFPTQMRKLIENGLMECGVPTDFMVSKDINERQKAWNALPEEKKLESKRYARVKEYEANIEALTDLRKKELEKEADIKRDKEGNIIMNDKLAAFLVGELSRQDLGEHEIAFLKQINGKLSKDLSISLSAEKMEKVLNSVVVRRLVKQKFKGEGLIQVSGAGFESVLGKSILSPNDKIIYGSPTIGKSYLKEKGANILSFDDDWRDEINTFIDSKRGSLSRQDYKAKNLKEYQDHLSKLWTKAKEVAAKENKVLFASNLNLIQNHASDFDKVINLSREEFTKRATKRGDKVEHITDWKNNIDAAIAKVDQSKVITTDMYLSDIMSTGLRANLTAEEKAKYGTNGLPFYQQEILERDKDGNPTKWGKTQAMKVKIAMQGDFVNLLHLNDLEGNEIRTLKRLNELLKNEEWLNTGDNRKMITIIGPRIPVQGLNSMEFAEVFEFLPSEAGNIVILPTEIVAKSGGDYDIDKLTFMMPNISSGVNYDYWTTEAGKAKLADLREQYPALAEHMSAETVALLIADRKKENKTLEERAVLRLLADNSQRNVKYATGNSAEGLENKILNNMREILELEENFVDLIRPNGTEIVKENIADHLTDLVMDFNPKTVVYKDKNGNDAKRIPGNRVFEIRYNLYKHYSNNIGKQTLGLGAVDNTYNSLFNRIGARMNHTYNAKGVEKRIKILLEHNTLKDEKGNDVVSLSHILDANGENSIADVISQLMNGWVDIAKEAWIFNIQGNKEVAPVLLFMVQAGVPVKQAIYMAANPMVRAYVKEQKLAKSPSAGPLGKSPGNWRYYRNQARKVILGQPKYGINFSDTQLKNATEIEKALQSKTLELTGDQGTMLDFFNPKNVEDNLLNRVKAFSAAQKQEGFVEANFYTDEDRAIFLHFLELEELAKSLTAIKTKTNVDTSRSNTLFEAQSRLEMVEELKQDGKFPDWMVDKLIGNPEKGIKGDSPIASFNVQGFQIKLWKDFFKLRNDPMVNDFILEKMKDSNYQDAVDETWGDSEKLIAQFRNGLVPFVFQNYMRNFNLDDIKDYKGVGVNEDYEVKGVSSLAHGVYVKNVDSKRTFYVDKMQLKKDYLGLTKKVKKTFSDAELNPVAFPTPGSYYNFVFERELLRSMYPADTHWSVLQERGDVQVKLKAYKQQFADRSEAEINALVYNETLRDMALDNTFNMWKLFNSKDSFADQLVQLQIMYPELAAKYAIMNTMAPSVREGGGSARTANIMLTDMMMDADKVNLFNQNLRELSNPAKIKISTNNAQEIQRVSEFFKKLSIYAFLQSGMNTTGMFSLVRVVPQDRFTGQMIPYAAEFMKDMNPLTLQRYWNKFLQVSKNKKLRSRLRDYSINNFNPAKDKALIKNTPLSKFKMTVDPQEARMTKDNAGNPLYYANPSVNQDGVPVKGLTISEAKDLAKSNPDKAFVMNGTTDSITGADKDEKALLKAKEETGNVIPFPTRKSFAYSGFEIRDVNPTEAAEIKTEQVEEAKPVTTDAFKYYGKFYDIKVIDGIAVDVLNVGKTTDKVKLLDAYNTNKNVDPQNGKAFRGATYVGDKVTEKTVVVPAGSKSTNLPIFETQDKVFLMNDGQQAAYDNIKSFVLSRLNQRDNNKEGVVFNSPMTKEFSGIIPQSMWNNMIGLVGRGGVGKTSVIRKVIDDIQKEVRGGNRYGGVTVAYAAPTHNAVTMLQEALGMDSERTGGVQTLASLVKRNQSFTSKDKEPTDKGADENGLFLQEKSLYEKGLQFNPAISDNDIIVIDESSMVDSQFIKDLMFRFASEKRGKMPIFIYMGDYRQLPPVDTKAGEKKDFREGIIAATLFSDENANKHSELTEVMRSKDELFHKVFDSVGNQITEQRKEVEEGKPVQTFDFAKYDALTNESSENMLVVNEKQVDAMIDDYVDTLATTDNPYEMFWTHYNNISNPRTQELFNKIRTAYFKRIGVPMPTGTMKAKNGATRYEIGVGDYIQSTFNLPFETKNDKQLGIEKGIIKPTARFKVLDIIQSEVSLSQLNSDLQRALGKNIDIAVKKIVLYNRQGQKRVVVFPVNNDTISIVGYNAAKRAQTLSIKDKEGKSHQVDIQYGKWKEIMNEVLQLNQSVEEMFLPSYIGSTHTVQGASIKKIIVGDYNIRLNAPNIAMRDMESSLYTALTRASEKLIIIKPNNAQIKDNQDVFQLKTVDKVPATIEEAKEVAVEGTPEKVVTPTKEVPLPLINGQTIDPRVKAQIDATIQSMLEYKANGYELAFPASGFGQYMIGADDNTGIIDPKKSPIARATFVYLSEQLFKNFQYVNPNFEKALYDQDSINVVQAGAPITDEEVQQALDYFEKTCKG